MAPVADHYKPPDFFTKHVFNPMVAALTRMGIGVYGSRVLEVRGRPSGERRGTPVNLLTVDGVQYLVAPRGHTQWVRNIRVAGGGRRRPVRRVQDSQVTELGNDVKPPCHRVDWQKWAWE